MTDLVELKGRINESGKLELELPDNLPPGEVLVTIERIEDDADVKADEALWDAQFAATPDSVFEAMIKDVDEAYAAGLIEDFDPDTDPDLQ